MGRIPIVACATCLGFPWDKADLGFLWSALFLMSVPVAAAGVIGGWVLYHARRARRARAWPPRGPARPREEDRS